MSTSTERSATLNHVVDFRVQVYGDPVETFVNIAKVWSGILGVEVNPTDVPLCLAGMKLVRTTQAPDYSDNSDDVDGYMDIFRKLVGPDMIHARSVDEYVAKKQARDREDALQQHRQAVEDIVSVVEPVPAGYRHGYCNRCKLPLLNHDSLSCEGQPTTWPEHSTGFVSGSREWGTV